MMMLIMMMMMMIMMMMMMMMMMKKFVLCLVQECFVHNRLPLKGLLEHFVQFIFVVHFVNPFFCVFKLASQVRLFRR